MKMKSYKLIKLLPFVNGPELGYISTPKPYSNGISTYFWKGVVFNPELYPEYWEEVVEEDYEILSFYKHTGNSEVVEVSKTDLALTVEKFFKNKCWEIHSAKRLSDGAVFTIGDKCVIGNKSLGLIASFKPTDDGLYVTSNQVSYPCQFTCKLDDLITEKKPLFITEDGVSIFEGSSPTIFLLRRVNDFHIKECTKNNVKPGSFSDNMYYFADKEKAEEYVVMNKPCLSIKDVIGSTYMISTLNIANLTSVVKERIKHKI